MSNLLKRTKKSCVKFFRKISSKQLFIKKLEEEEEISTDNIIQCSEAIESTTEPNLLPDEANNTRSSSESLTPSINQYISYTNYAVQDNQNDVGNDVDENHNTTILHSLTSKLFLTADGYEFHRLQQLRSDTASEILQFESESENGVVFEKVKLKKHVRYFQSTPPSSSTDNFMPEIEDLPFRSNTLHEVDNNFELEINSLQQNLCVPFNMSLGSQIDEHFHNVIICEERGAFNKNSPVVKWDINGNSLDQDIFVKDSWEEFDNSVNRLQDTGQTKFKLGESQKSSFQSSSTTLETWLEDELIDNSFNEQLSFRFDRYVAKT